MITNFRPVRFRSLPIGRPVANYISPSFLPELIRRSFYARFRETALKRQEEKGIKIDNFKKKLVRRLKK